MVRTMKDSGIDWIGLIPENWKIEKNKHCFICSKEIIGDKSGETQLLSLTTKGVKQKSQDDVWGKVPESYDTYQIVNENDLIMCLFDLDCSAVFSGISPHNGMISPAYKVLSCRKDFSSRFADYWFQFVFDGRKFKSYAKNLRYTLSYDEFGLLPIVFFSTEEQEKIADFLEKKCVEIDSAIEKTKESIEEYLKMKQAVMTKAVMKGIRGNRDLKNSGTEWMGDVPKEWTYYRIANLYEERKEQGREDLPILQVSIHSGITDHEIADEDADRVFVRSEDRTKYQRVYPGDLAYNMMRAWQGAFGAVRVEGMISPAYVAVKPIDSSKLDSRYMEALFRTPMGIEEMHRYSYGVADFRLRLYWQKFRDIRVCIPSIEEQIEIADFIDNESKKFDDIIQKKKDFICEIEKYKKSMIYEYVTGKKEVLA